MWDWEVVHPAVLQVLKARVRRLLEAMAVTVQKELKSRAMKVTLKKGSSAAVLSEMVVKRSVRLTALRLATSANYDARAQLWKCDAWTRG